MSTVALTFDPARFKLLPSARGGLRIWQEPEAGKLYVAGIDTSKGGAKSDFAALAMVETASRDLVATWHGRYDPTSWGRMCARLGLYYNEAMLAFETHPSQHGLSACLAARDMGYSNLYRRQSQGMVEFRMSEELGWATTFKTKPLMIDRVRVALAENYKIPSADLLRELLGFKRDEGGNVVSTAQHDDLFVAYSIAQLVADVVGITGYVSRGPERPMSWTQAWWKHRNATLEQGAKHGARRPTARLQDGT